MKAEYPWVVEFWGAAFSLLYCLTFSDFLNVRITNELAGRHTYLASYTDSGEPHFRLHVCTASPLSTEPPPQPQMNLFPYMGGLRKCISNVPLGSRLGDMFIRIRTTVKKGRHIKTMRDKSNKVKRKSWLHSRPPKQLALLKTKTLSYQKQKFSNKQIAKFLIGIWNKSMKENSKWDNRQALPSSLLV